MTVDTIAELPRTARGHRDHTCLARTRLERREARKTIDGELVRERVAVLYANLCAGSRGERRKSVENAVAPRCLIFGRLFFRLDDYFIGAARRKQR